MELDTPVALHWDLPDDDPPFLSPLINELALIPFLTIHMTASGPLPERFRRLLDDPSSMPGKRLLLTLPYAQISSVIPVPRRLTLVYAAVEREEEIDQLRGITSDVSRFGISLAQGMTRSPAGMIRHALRAGFCAVHIPIPRTSSAVLSFVPSADELFAIERDVCRDPFPPTLRLLVHDPFLWRALHPGESGWTAGCQGANALIHLDRQGMVRGCPLIPEPIGTLRSGTLRAILDDAPRRRVREMVRQIPSNCLQCPHQERCRGGCRGRAFLAGLHRSADPCCPHLHFQEGFPSP